MTSISATQIDLNPIDLNPNPITLIPGNTVSQLGTVGATNFDSYNIVLNEPQLLDVSLFNISTSADIVITDSNGNPVPSGGGSQPLTTPENFRVPLNPGNYQVQVFQPSNDLSLGDSNYQLDIESIASNNPPIQPPINLPDPANLIDTINDNPNTPTVLSSLVPDGLPINRFATINDSNFDAVDYYSVTVEQPLTAGIGLQNLTGNIDVAVLDSNGNLIARGENLGTLAEGFQAEFSNPGEYLINVYQTASGINSDYNLGIFPGNIIQAPPPSPTISIQSLIENTNEAVRNRENTAFVFKEDYLLNATANTPVTIDLTSNNAGFDPLLEVYQIPQDSLLDSREGQIVAANDNGGGGVDAIIGPGVVSDIPGVSSELTLSPEFNYLVRVTYTELPLIGSFTLDVSVDNGFVSLTEVLFGTTTGDPIIGGDPSINGLF
ncbi:MAG: hypothetical protein AB4080_02050 [Trichodesmium sp.]